MGVLDGVKAKIDRADGLIEELRARIEPISATAIRSIRRETDGDETKLLFRVTELPSIDNDIAVVVGDVLHNLRSALDHLAWQLVLFDGGQPNKDTKFPIFTKVQARPVTIKPEINSKEILAALTEAQPFSEAAHGHDPLDDSLELVRVLNNYDKHHLLLAVVCSIDGDLPAYWGSNHGDSEPAYRFTVGPLGPGSVVARFDFRGHRAPSHFKPVFNLAVSLMVPEARWLAHRSIADGLAKLSSGVRRQINYGGFVALLGEQHI